MHDDHEYLLPDPEPNRGLSTTRRQLFQGAALLGAALLVPVKGGLLRPVRARAAEGPAGLLAYSNAMHVHASFSEGEGSWQSQLSEAARCGIDVLWPTDHDWRMSACDYITDLHFKTGQVSNGTKVTYKFSTSGSVSSKTGLLTTSPTCPDDPTGGTLSIGVSSSGTAPASERCLIGPSDRLSANLAGSTFTIRVFPVQCSGDAWLEVLMNLSYHTAMAGRKAGIYQLSYHIGGTDAGRSSSGLLGVVNVPAPVGQWSTVTLDPVSDIAAIWPDLPDPRDNTMLGLWLGATSRNRAPARGYFACGELTRTLTSGNQPLETQRDILSTLSTLYPSVTLRHGLEISFNAKHSNWFGGAMEMPQYPDVGVGDITAKSMQLIHGYGGLGSYNHPFGVKQLGLASQSTQDVNRRKLAVKAISNHAYGADIIEAGYHQRGTASLETHLALWDTLSRNGIWLTGNGVSDNHSGKTLGWTADKGHNTFCTFIWAASRSESDLLAGLRSGAVFCGEIGVWGGDIWIEAEGNPMGSVSVDPNAPSRQLAIEVSGLGSSQVVEVVRGTVDYAGSLYPDPNTEVVQTFTTGMVTTTIDTSTSCFVRLNILDTLLKRRIAFSNPIWLLRSTPPEGIPSARVGPS